jgi:hypothetical protein
MRAGCDHAGPLRHVVGFPDLGLLRVLRPTPTASVGDGPSRRTAGSRAGQGPPGWFPRSLPTRSTGSAPSYAPAASPRLPRRPSPWPPDRRHHPTKEFPARHRRAGGRCSPARIRQVGAGGSLERLSAAGSSRTPFRLASRTQAIWQCWPVPSLSGLLPPSPPSRDQAALSCGRLPATSRWRRPSMPLGSGAPRGARRRRPTTGSARSRRTCGPPGPVRRHVRVLLRRRERASAPVADDRPLTHELARCLRPTRMPASASSAWIRRAP